MEPTLLERDPDAGSLLGEVRQLRDAGKLPAAERLARQATELDPSNAEAQRLLGTVLTRAARAPEGLACLRRAVELDPTSPKAHLHLAIALGESGQLVEAVAADRRALELRPGYPQALGHIAQVKEFAPHDADLPAFVAADTGAMSDQDAILFLFGKAKALEDAGRDAEAFAALRHANALRRHQMQYDNEAAIAFLEGIADAFGADVFDRLADAGHPSRLPILVTGMPRSGTTLVEQILASHPAVHGAGELSDLHQLSAAIPLLTQHRAQGAARFPAGIWDMSAPDFAQLGHAYVTRLHGHDPSAERVCDKYPHNFLFLGLARLIVPNASVIHCVREPMDTCLSCYGKNMAALEFSYDLEELGAYYRAYRRLVDHWHATLPAGWVLDVVYEELVGDLEGGARRIVEHCGLPWDDACLRFHTTDRPVRTASFAQVRRPVYRSSIGRWRRFASELEPLRQALGEYAPATSPGEVMPGGAENERNQG